MDGQKMVSENPRHFQTLVKIIYFLPPPSSIGHMIAIISTLQLLQRND